MKILKKIFSYEYLTIEHLKGFDKYKYSSIDTSPLSVYVMHPFWNAIVNLYPMWLAPNVLTFVGFLCLIANFILFSIYDYNFYGYCKNELNCSESLMKQNYELFNVETNLNYSKLSLYLCSCIPSFLWLMGAIFQFLSHHLDGTDGKQARRTNTSSPLGELFDHGLDSWATLFLPVSLYSMFGRNEFGASVLDMYFILWTIMGIFLISHWEKYNTGVLFLPWSYDLAQIGMTVAFLTTFIFGQSIWSFDTKPYLGFKLIQIVQFLIYTTSFGLSLPVSAYNLYVAYKTKKLKQNTFYEAMRPLFATTYLFLIQSIWIYVSKVNILELEPRAFYWLTGTLFSNITCRVIVAQMTSTRCEVFNWILIPLSIVVGLASLANIQGYYEVYFVYLMALLVTLSHVHYGICTVNQICKHLNIYCFTITSKPVKNSQSQPVKNKEK